MDLTQRILVGGGALTFLVGYVAWRWHRAGKWVEARDALQDAARQYFEAMKLDSRWHALKSQVEQRHRLTFEHDGDPAAYVVHQIGVVDDRGQMYRPDNAGGPTRVTALIVRRQPHSQLFVSMDLRTGEVREDPAPHGWTYFGPYL